MYLLFAVVQVKIYLILLRHLNYHLRHPSKEVKWQICSALLFRSCVETRLRPASHGEEKEQETLDTRLLPMAQQVADEGIVDSE